MCKNGMRKGRNNSKIRTFYINNTCTELIRLGLELGYTLDLFDNFTAKQANSANVTPEMKVVKNLLLVVFSACGGIWNLLQQEYASLDSLLSRADFGHLGNG